MSVSAAVPNVSGANVTAMAADSDLAAKLKQELQWENEAGSTAEPEFLADFKKEGNFDVRLGSQDCVSNNV